MDGTKAIEFYLQNLEYSEVALTEDDLGVLCKLSAAPAPLTRIRVSTLLADHYDPMAVETLMKLTGDAHSLVRADAADSLRIARSRAAFQRLLELSATDPSYLVRGYAVLSARDVERNVHGDTPKVRRELYSSLLPQFQKEQHPWVLAIYCKVFYQCGELIYLQSLIDYMAQKDFRANVTQCLTDILSPENEQLIREVVLYYYPMEQDGAARGKMEELFALIDDCDWA